MDAAVNNQESIYGLFGIFCLANLGVWQLPKYYGKGKKR
jgi:cytochrome oxidase assembly protein ShyY1